MSQVTLVFLVSRLRKEENVEQLVLQEYTNKGVIKALARVYFGWENPSLSGLFHAANWGDGWSYSQDQERGAYVKYVIPLNKHIASLRGLLKPYKGQLLNPKEDENGVSLFKGLQLHVTLKGTCSVSKEEVETPEGKVFKWETFQFPTDAVVSLKLYEAKNPGFIQPYQKAGVIDIVEAELKPKGRNRRKKQRWDSKIKQIEWEIDETWTLLQEARREALEAKTALYEASVEGLQKKLESLNAQLEQELSNLSQMLEQ